MRTVSYKSIQDFVFAGASLDPDDTSLGDAQRNTVAGYINDRVRTAWEWVWWPELMRLEERAYRRTWGAADTYAADDEVFYEDAYYVALRGNTAVTPGSSADDWAETELTDRYIELNRLGETAIGEVRAVTIRDPRVSVSPGAVKFEFGANGIQFDSTAPASTVWVEFRLQPNVFTGELWTAAKAALSTYNRDGYLVLLPDDGEVYKSILVGGNPYWLKVEMPFVVSNFVKRAALADYQTMLGNKGGAERNEEAAWVALRNAADNVFGMQGQSVTAAVETY